MTLTEIKNAVDAGQVVHWANEAYVVMKDRLGRYLIHCVLNDSCIGLTNLAGDQMNGGEADFFLGDVK